MARAHRTAPRRPPRGRREPEILEDGLLLWLVALRNAPAAHAPLLDLFPLLLRAMADSTGAGARARGAAARVSAGNAMGRGWGRNAP